MLPYINKAALTSPAPVSHYMNWNVMFVGRFVPNQQLVIQRCHLPSDIQLLNPENPSQYQFEGLRERGGVPTDAEPNANIGYLQALS